MAFSTDESTMGPAQPNTGLLALVVHPSGHGALSRLSHIAPLAAQVLAELVGGNLELLATSGSPDGEVTWCAYINEDGARLGLPPNPLADAMARVLGYPFAHGDYLKGVAVFLGRIPGVFAEQDVPQFVIDLARRAGVNIRPTVTPSVIP